MNAQAKLDGSDKEILALLVDDGRGSVADLARRTGSAPAVNDGSTASNAAQVVGSTKVEDIAKVAEGLPEVRALFTVAGDPDALAWLRVRDVDDLKRVIDRLRRSGKVTGTKTLMVLDAKFRDRRR